MKIKRFKINRFRSLVDFEVKDFESTTIFYGENNAGKSNVLNALNSIFSRKRKYTDGQFSEPENFYEGVQIDFANNFYNNDYINTIDFKVELEVSHEELNFDKEIVSLKKISGTAAMIIEGDFSSDGTAPNIGEIKINNIKYNGVDILTNIDGKVTFFPTLDPSRNNQGPLNTAFSKLVDPFNDCIHIINSDRDMHWVAFGNEKQTIITPQNFKSFLHGLYLSPTEHSVFEEINRIFNSDPFNFGSLSFANDNEGLEIMVKNGDVRLPIKHIGSGVLQTLYILASIIYSKSKIVCIEELEQNLSPKKQIQALQKIQSIITESKGKKKSLDQIIISSHSSVYAKPKLGAIYILEKTANITTVDKKLVLGYSKPLAEHLAPTLNTVLYPEDKMAEVRKILKELHDFD